MNKWTDEHNIYADINYLHHLQFKAKGLNFTPNQAVNSVLNGKYVSKLRGRGLNFEELRHYRPGDDIRCMDWKVTRRTGKPHIKVFTEERERNIFLIIDQRSSMFFGSTHKMKSVIAAEVSALISWRVTQMGDRIGAFVFNDENSFVIPAKRGKQHVIHVLNKVVQQNHLLKVGQSDNEPSIQLNKILSKVSNICGHDALVIFIADGYGWNDKSTDYLKRLRLHNEVIMCQISDPLELSLPKMSQMVISDGEYQIQFSSNEYKIQNEYQKEIQKQQNEYQNSARKHRIPLIHINTIEPTEQQLRKAFGGR